MRLKKRILCIVFVITTVVFSPAVFPAQVEIGTETAVKVLYDFSGSMYPGYPHTPRHISGVDYFHRYERFRTWFRGFISAQTRFNAGKVSLSIFRSLRSFQPGDIKETHPPVPVREFNVSKAFSQSKPPGVDYTYLAESLDHFTGNNFAGIVWLITDNRVETGGAHTTRDFFIGLRDKPKYRSVHIYKLPFEDQARNQRSDLAVYGILVSPEPIADQTAQWYDERFFEFENIFGERLHLKLKDLSVNPINIDIEPVEINIAAYQKKFSEGKIVNIPMKGKIRSNLTQHTITKGTLKIEMTGDFIPDAKARKDYGVENVSCKLFREVEINLPEDIPPKGTKELNQFYIKSKKKVPLSFSGIGNSIKAAAGGLRVKYTGKGRVSSDRIQVALKQEGWDRINGIYSSGEIGPVFGAQSEVEEIQAKPADFEISFLLKNRNIWGLILLLAVLLLLVPLVLLGIFLTRREKYRIHHEQNEETIELMRLSSRGIRCGNFHLGVLKRGLGNRDTLTPNRARAGLSVSPGKQKGEFAVSIDTKDEKKSFKLTIEPLNKSRAIEHITGPSTHTRSTPGAGVGRHTGTGPTSPGNRGAKPGKSGPGIKIRRPT